MATKTLAKFTGHELVTREISTADWKAAGVEQMPTTRWDATNRRVVDVSGWPEAALDVLREDPEFRLTEQEFDGDEYDDLSFADLREQAKERGLSAGGSAADLRARLREADGDDSDDDA